MMHIGHSVFDIDANEALQAMALLVVFAAVCTAVLMFGWLVMDILDAGLRYSVEEASVCAVPGEKTTPFKCIEMHIGLHDCNLQCFGSKSLDF
jgi:hypothetical protein